MGDAEFDVIHSSRELARIVPAYDYVLLAAPLTAETRGIVDAEVLAAMNPAACLLNVGRGELVDNLARYCKGEPLLNVVDKSLGFVPSN